MDSIKELLMSWGYWGMLLSAFLAGSVLPFNSEIVMASLQAAGLDVWQLVAYGTIGNVLGGALNYGVGRLGNLYWIEHYLHVSREKLEKTERFMGGRGALMGFFAFLPILGSAITVVLGLTKANIPLSLLSMTAGKLLRYLLLVYSMGLML